MNHAAMRGFLRPAFKRVIGRDGVIPELQCLQSIASLESAYGRGWKPPGHDSKNLGAIQAGSAWRGKTFSYTDTEPLSDGSSRPYVTRFRWYETWEEAADDLVRTVYVAKERGTKVLPYARMGDTRGFSTGLYDTVYYQGFGPNREVRIGHHHDRVVASIRAQALALGEPLPTDIATMPFLPELLRLGSSGAAVVTLQEQLNRHGATPPLKADGNFGQKTKDAVIAFQRGAHLVADGIVGPRTWEALTIGTANA